MTETLSKGERTSQAIGEAAYSLFIEQGFHATSMRQIAQRAGIALSGIYNHFQSKEQIFDHVLLEKHPYHQILEILQSAPGDTIEEFIHNAAHAIVNELGSRPEFLKLAFIELSEFKGRHIPRLFQIIAPQFLPMLQRFSGAQGQMRAIAPQVFLPNFLGMFFAYYISETIVNPSGALPLTPNTIDNYVDIFLHGILKPEQP